MMPKYVPTGTTPPSVDSDKSSEETDMKAAKAASLKEMAYQQHMDDSPMPTITEATEPHVSAAAGSSGSTVVPTPRTKAAEAVAKMSLGPQPPRDQGA